MNIKDRDYDFIRLAMSISRKNAGLTAENPSVGCVIVHNNEIIASAITALGGRPHAESIAIAKVDNKEILKESTIYISLEPCCHFGKTPPCVLEIIKYRFAKVVIGAIDRDQRVNGKSIQLLRENNITVKYLELDQYFEAINPSFAIRSQQAMPKIIGKIATSIDGKIATHNFASKWLSNEHSRQFVHYLRSQVDAVMIGANTLRFDNPQLNCRLAGFEGKKLRKIIVANHNNFNKNLTLLQNPKDLVILTQNPLEWQDLEKAKAQIIDCSKILIAEKEAFTDKTYLSIDFGRILEIFRQLDLYYILAEGGSSLITSLVKQNIFSELYWFSVNKIIGNDGISAIGNLGYDSIKNMENLQLELSRSFGDDIMHKYTAISLG